MLKRVGTQGSHGRKPRWRRWAVTHKRDTTAPVTPVDLVAASGWVVADNLVAHCRDFSTDVNRSEHIVIAHNTLINTGWIDLRNSPSSAAVYGNWMEGRLRVRRGAWGEAMANADEAFSRFFARPDAIDLRWTQQPQPVATSRAAHDDFCGRQRGPQSPAGALGLEAFLASRPVRNAGTELQRCFIDAGVPIRG